MPKFEPQRTFQGPPIFAPIPDSNDPIDPKRQTFVPIEATIPKNRLPVIATPTIASGKFWICINWSIGRLQH